MIAMFLIILEKQDRKKSVWADYVWSKVDKLSFNR